MTEIPPELDELALRGHDTTLKVRIGQVDLGPAVLNGQFRTAMQELPTTTLTLDTRLLAGQPVDYFGLVQVAAPNTRLGPTFAGNVVAAAPEPSGLELTCQTHPSLTESRVGRFESYNCDGREVIYLMTRTGGLTDDQISIEGLDELPLEVIEVLVPLTGVAVDAPVHLGALSLLDPKTTLPLLEPFQQGEMYETMAAADSHAVYRQVARGMLDVEQRAIRAVDVMLGWTATRARYGLAYLPNGEPQEFTRAQALSRPERADVIFSRGLESGRMWLRELTIYAPDDQIVVESDGSQWTPPAPDELSTAQQLAFMALRRATTLDDTLQRIQALWEAIEFYVARIGVGRRFSRAEAKRVRKRVPKDIDPALRQRVMDLLGKINDPPLMAKLREAARRDGVPITDAEMDLLQRVRTVRNDTAHGRQADVPSTEDVNYAVSVVARLLMHGAARR
jgi:hypothetical protein